MYDGLNLMRQDWLPEVVPAIATFAGDVQHEIRRSEKDNCFPREIYQQMGRRGWIGPFSPAVLGGLGAGVAEYCVLTEELARHGLVTPQVSVQGQLWLLDWGTDAQRERYLGPIARGEMIFSESISEPGAGSSLRQLTTTARQVGTDWVISGDKTHVNLGADCDVTLVYAMAPEGLTAFLVDADLPGVAARKTDPIGLRLIPTADMHFEDVRVPAAAMLGTAGGGMATFLTTFNVSRLGNASELIGFGRRALSEAVTYAAHRKVRDEVVTSFQGIQWTVADCYSALHGASLARNHASNLATDGSDVAFATSLAKKMAIQAAELSVNEVFSLVGSHGLYTSTDFARLLHDVKVLRIAGGSLEVLRNFVAHSILRDPGLCGLL